MPILPIRRRGYPISEEGYDVNVYPGFRTEPAPYDIAPIPQLEEPLPIHGERTPIRPVNRFGAEPSLRPESRPILSPSEEYTSVVGDVPQREDYSPSTLRKILAIASGVSTGYLRSREAPSEGGPAAYEATTNILEQPYRRALEKYSTGVGVSKAKLDEQMRQAEEERKQRGVGFEERKVGIGERGVGIEEEESPGIIDLRKAQAEKLRRPETRQPTAFESQMAIFQELQKTPEGRELWDKFQKSGEESIEEWGQKQDRLQQDRIKLAREQSGLRRQEAREKPIKEGETDFDVLDEASDRVAGTIQFKKFFTTVKTNQGNVPVLKDDEALMEENGWIPTQLEENKRRLDKAIQAEYNRVTRIGGGGRKYEGGKVGEDE